jgi:hypothetical protein
LVFFFDQEFFELERRDVAERRVKALGIVEGFNVSRRKTKEQKHQRAKEMTSQMVLSPRSLLTCHTVDRQSVLPVKLRASEIEKS